MEGGRHGEELVGVGGISRWLRGRLEYIKNPFDWKESSSVQRIVVAWTKRA